jgi:hypothetical protein
MGAAMATDQTAATLLGTAVIVSLSGMDSGIARAQVNLTAMVQAECERIRLPKQS